MTRWDGTCRYTLLGFSPQACFMCLNGCAPAATAEPLIVCGGSRSMLVALRASVGRSLIGKAWPPIAFALPGSTSAVVMPPETESLYASSCVFRPSRLRSHGRIGPWSELPSDAPESAGAE